MVGGRPARFLLAAPLDTLTLALAPPGNYHARFPPSRPRWNCSSGGARLRAWLATNTSARARVSAILASFKMCHYNTSARARLHLYGLSYGGSLSTAERGPQRPTRTAALHHPTARKLGAPANRPPRPTRTPRRGFFFLVTYLSDSG